jgi:outer membrane protein OmpA-like peptidoglycan-associated protein
MDRSRIARKRSEDDIAVRQADAVDQQAQPTAAPAQGAAGHDFAQLNLLRRETPVAETNRTSAEPEADSAAARLDVASGASPAAADSLPDVGPVSAASAPMPEAVTSAIGETGAPMPAATRAAMEDQFGVGFGAVRIHDGDRAADSARAIGAQAYTVGRDIVFSRDRYQPDTTEGAQLLAHELTHVVQQSPGAAAHAGVAPQPVGVQGKPETVGQPGWGDGGKSSVTFNPHAELVLDNGTTIGAWFPGGDRETMIVPRGVKGTLTIYEDMWWHWNGGMLEFDKRGTMNARASASVDVSQDGKLTLQNPMTPTQTGGEPSLLTMSPNASGNTGMMGDDQGWATLNVALDFNGTTATNVTRTGGGGLDIKPGGVGAGTGYTRQEGTTVTVAGASRPMRSPTIDLKVARPEGPVTLPETKIVSYGTKVHFSPPGSAKLSDDSIGAVTKWYINMPLEAREMLARGESKVHMVGHTSTTGGHGANLNLSADRTAAVLAMMKIAAPQLKPDQLNIENQGKENARTDDQVESELERRVDIYITYPEGGLNSPNKPATPSAP